MRISMAKTLMTRRINRMGKTKLKYSEYVQNCVKVKGASPELKEKLMSLAAPKE